MTPQTISHSLDTSIFYFISFSSLSFNNRLLSLKPWPRSHRPQLIRYPSASLRWQPATRDTLVLCNLSSVASTTTSMFSLFIIL